MKPVVSEVALSVVYRPVILTKSVRVSYEEVLEEGSVVVCMEYDRNNRCVLFWDFFVSCYGNCVADEEDEKEAQVLATELVLSVTGNRCNFSSKLSRMEMPMLFETVQEAQDFIDLFTRFGLPVRAERLLYKSWKTFTESYGLVATKTNV